MHLIDGQSMFDMPIQQYWKTTWAQVAKRSGIPTPDPNSVATENLAILHISHGRLVAECPNCHHAEYVWRKGPYIMVCANCGNSDIKGRCRSVVMPTQEALNKIETLLMARSDPATRNWFPGEALEDLLKENEARGLV